MKKILILLLTSIIFTSCEQISMKKIKELDIKNYGIPDEADKFMFECGIDAITYDKKGNIHFYVREIKPDTRKKIEQKLIEIFGQKVDFTLHNDFGAIDSAPK
ncbi:hypothetical protein [Ectobacillus panaciterrae]|uniref:hypothetical protein n=1 Tax=Ectobacillus panaciterrae TaxID=363872 RepID=UPI0003FD1B5C|nr:hypothetical protein [Ectobacillus panaciterrae]